MGIISEWQSPDAKSIVEVVFFFVPIALSVIGFIHTDKNVSFIDLMLLMIFVFLFLRSVRFIILWYIVAPFVCFKYLPAGPKVTFDTAKTKLLLFIFSIICVILLFAGIINVGKACREKTPISSVLDETAIEAVKDSNPQRLFNDYNFGEALIYNDIPVFFDARADLFSECGILSDGVELMFLQPINDSLKKEFDVDEMISKYRFDYILINKNRPLYPYLQSHSADYSVIFEDEEVGYFEVRNVKEVALSH